MVKGIGIVLFFALVSVYSWWIQGLNEWDGNRHRELLEVVGEEAEVARNGTGRQCVNVEKESPLLQCEMARMYCAEESGQSMVNYLVLHYCQMGGVKWISVPVLVTVLVLAFYILAETAENYFSPVVRRLVEMLGMTPSMGGVTLLALGNGAPDIFASLAAIGGGNSRIGFGAILSAGTFVSAFVVGSVALAAAPFSVRPMPFVRDLTFYFGAVCLLFIIYLKGEIVFWQAVGMVSFYVVFVVVVLCTDKQEVESVSKIDEVLEGATDMDPERVLKKNASLKESNDSSKVPGMDDTPDEVDVVVDISSFKIGEPVKMQAEPEEKCWDQLFGPAGRFAEILKTEEVIMLLHTPTTALLKSTIPEIEPAKWSRNYGTANVVLCPLLILYMFTSFISLNRHIVFLSPSLRLPIWLLILLQGSFMGAAYYLAVKRPPTSGQFVVVTVAFIMSVFWISVIAGELLGCLVTLGIILGVSPALLGLTVLAWGNSIGDLVADVAVARVGQPAMAVAGCFAGPMFNMLVGLGSALCLRTAKEFPVGYQLDHHPGILVAFGFLTLNLLGTLIVVSSSKFQLTRFWGKCLISWYILFMVVSVVVAQLVSVGSLN